MLQILLLLNRLNGRWVLLCDNRRGGRRQGSGGQGHGHGGGHGVMSNRCTPALADQTRSSMLLLGLLMLQLPRGFSGSGGGCMFVRRQHSPIAGRHVKQWGSLHMSFILRVSGRRGGGSLRSGSGSGRWGLWQLLMLRVLGGV